MDERRSWFERTFEDTKKIVLQAGRRAIRRYPMLREDLDDLIQDTYLELYRKSDQLRAHPNLPGWLVETLNRKAKNRARKRMRELNRRISMDYPPASFEPDGDCKRAGRGCIEPAGSALPRRHSDRSAGECARNDRCGDQNALLSLEKAIAKKLFRKI